MAMRAHRSNGHRGFLLVIIGTLLLFGGFSAWATDSRSAESSDTGLIVIDALRQFGPLHRPAIVFPHDQHTRALAKEQQDCQTCHPKQEDRLSLNFKRPDQATGPPGADQSDRQTVMDLYHEQCVGCHQSVRKAGRQGGPETCGECHRVDGESQGVRQPIQLDKYLHFRHTRTLEDHCEQCHHQYDEQAGKLVYVKGQEGACIYCHKGLTEDNRISNRKASHLQCISCHLQRQARNQTGGPSQCGNCHDPALQELIVRPAAVPRLARSQPDSVLVRRYPSDSAPPAAWQGLGPVSFDHRAHETANDSCRVCHHADLGTCIRCHSPAGTPEGGGIVLDQAMHRTPSRTSCVGCHRTIQQQPRCVGCHYRVPARSALSEAACQVCHTNPPQSEPVPANQETANALAQQLRAQRPAAAERPTSDQIPETVTISRLIDQYEAAVMPHRKIFLALANGIAANTLAAGFHTESTTLCRSCHHHSPGSLTPPSCASCHGKSLDATDPARPALLAAYHRQCMDCHEHMGMEKPTSRQCTACHAQRTPERADR